MSDKSKNTRIERTVYVLPTVKPGDSVRYGDWRDKPTDTLWLEKRKHGDLQNISEGHYVTGVPLTLIEATIGSDYSGNLVEISNARVLKERFPWLVEIYGDYGTAGLAYLGKRENQNPELIEAIDALTDYCLADDGDHSDLEMEMVDQAWAEDGRDDFKRALVEYFNEQYTPDEHDLDNVSDERIDRLWHDCTERLNGGESFHNEQGDQIYFPIDDIMKKIGQCWPGMSKPGYDGSPSLDWQLVRLAEDCTIDTGSNDTESDATPSLPDNSETKAE